MNKEEQLEFIENNYLKIATKEISRETGLTNRQVWLRAEKLGLTSKSNKEVCISDKQHQIIISGILGDGNLRLNGKNNYYYRECHSVKEEDYLLWKYNELGDLTKGMRISKIESRAVNQNPQRGFNTITTPSLIKYSKKSKSQLISELDELGLLLYLMDDGWFRKYSETTGALALAVDGLTNSEKAMLVNRFKSVLRAEGNLTCKNKSTIQFKSKDLINFFKVAQKYLCKSMDIVQKKFEVLV